MLSGLEYDVRKVMSRLEKLERTVHAAVAGNAGATGERAQSVVDHAVIRWEIPFQTNEDLLSTDTLLDDTAKVDSLV